MTGHKTSGDWLDVTSLGRNEIVFEGRNKDYGAYFVRQRYNRALLLALLTATSIGVLCVGIPFLVHILSKNDPVTNTAKSGPFILKKYVEHIDNKIIIPPPPTVPRPPASTVEHTVPIVAVNTPIETIPTNTQTLDHPVGSTTTPGPTTGTDPIGPITGAGSTVITPVVPEPPVTIVQKMPAFNGDIQTYIVNHTNYPAYEKDQNIQGTVYLTFVVETDGTISNIQILRGVLGGQALDNEAVRVIKSMPPWSPGMQNGHAVRVQFNLPIHFALQ